jgi:hypothetical protein
VCVCSHMYNEHMGFCPSPTITGFSHLSYHLKSFRFGLMKWFPRLLTPNINYKDEDLMLVFVTSQDIVAVSRYRTPNNKYKVEDLMLVFVTSQDIVSR